MFRIDTPASKVENFRFRRAPRNTNVTEISVINEDSIVVTRTRTRWFCVHDDVTPEDAYAGAGMQEESIFRRTSIHRCLVKNLYPIRDDECLYCRDITVVFDLEANNYWTLFTTYIVRRLPGCQVLSTMRRIPKNVPGRRDDRNEMKIKLIWLAPCSQTWLSYPGCIDVEPTLVHLGHVAKIMVDMVRRYSRIKYVVSHAQSSCVFAKAMTCWWTKNVKNWST
jgi:hypothetical protein